MSHIKLAAELRKSLGRAKRKLGNEEKGLVDDKSGAKADSFASYDTSSSSRKHVMRRTKQAIDKRRERRRQGSRPMDPVIAKEKRNRAKHLLFPSPGKVTAVVSHPTSC